MSVEYFFLRARNDTYLSGNIRGCGFFGEPLEGRMGVWFIVCIISQTINDTMGGRGDTTLKRGGIYKTNERKGNG